MEVMCLDQQEKVSLGEGMMDLARRAVKEALKAAGRESSGAINIAFLDDDGIRELNARYLGHDYPTDVLAFPPGEEIGPAGDERQEAGDIAISAETALRQSQEYGHSLDEEISLLVAHGVLHLLGYDDSPEKGPEMRMKEDLVLKALGFKGGRG